MACGDGRENLATQVVDRPILATSGQPGSLGNRPSNPSFYGHLDTVFDAITTATNDTRHAIFPLARGVLKVPKCFATLDPFGVSSFCFLYSNVMSIISAVYVNGCQRWFMFGAGVSSTRFDSLLG